MKKCSIHLKVFSALFLIIKAQGYEAHGQSDVQGIWSGTVKMKQEYTGELGHSVLEITTTFSANKGSGSMKYEAQWKAAFGTRNVVCNGSGNAELYHLDISEEDNVYYSYYIHVIGPDYTCSPVDDNPGQDARDITISDKVAIPNNSILSGTRTETVESGTGPVTTTYSWNLVRSTVIDVELIVTPEKYDTWLPEPGMNELQVGSIMNISLKLQARGGGPTTKKAKAFELKLSNTSKEPGITINFPIVPLDTTMPDLRFLIQSNASIREKFQSLEIGCPGGCQTAQAKLGSYDGGGWTVLTAEAILTDNTRIQGRLLVSGGEIDIRIPKRDPNSKIGTAWLTANGNPNEVDDKETSTGNNNNGDGLTAYEEYRGVISQGRFKRLDPNKKELGVKVDKAELPMFSTGIKWFENGSSLKVIPFHEMEIGGDRRLNKNAFSAHVYDQFVLLLYKGLLAYIGGALGCAFTTTNGPDIPANTTSVVIDVAAVYNEYNAIATRERPARLPLTVLEMLANTVAHEMGHGVNIWHHGQLPNVPSQIADTPSVHRYRIFRSNGSEVLTRPFSLDGGIGKRGNQESGDLSCVMVYYPYLEWAYTDGADGAKIFNEVPLIPIGKDMCNTNAGTQFNHSIIYFGDATKGNCLKQIKLK